MNTYERNKTRRPISHSMRDRFAALVHASRTYRDLRLRIEKAGDRHYRYVVVQQSGYNPDGSLRFEPLMVFHSLKALNKALTLAEWLI